MKYLKIAAVGLLVLLVVAFIVLWIGVDATGLGNTALSQLGIEGGMDASIEGAQFSLRHGLSLQGLEAAASTESGDMEAYIESLDVEVRWMPLLRGEVEILSLTLQSPRLSVMLLEEALQATAETPVEPEPAEPTSAVALRIDVVELQDAEIVVTVEGRPDALLTVEQLDVRLEDVTLDPTVMPPLLGVTGSGDATIGAAVVGSLQVDHATGRASLAAGRLEMTDVVATAPAGNLSVPRLMVDMTTAPTTLEMEMAADSIDLGVLAGYPEAQPLGDAALTATLSGSTGGALTGGGVFQLEPGGLPQSPSLTALDALLGTSLSSAVYEQATIHANPVPGGIRIEPFELLSSAVRLRGDGTLMEGQTLDMSMSVGIPRAAASAVNFTDTVLDVLTDEDGWVNFPVRVAGTVLEPSYGVDMDAVKALAAARARRSLMDEGGRRLGRILGGVCCGG